MLKMIFTLEDTTFKNELALYFTDTDDAENFFYNTDIDASCKIECTVKDVNTNEVLNFFSSEDDSCIRIYTEEEEIFHFTPELIYNNGKFERRFSFNQFLRMLHRFELAYSYCRKQVLFSECISVSFPDFHTDLTEEFLLDKYHKGEEEFLNTVEKEMVFIGNLEDICGNTANYLEEDVFKPIERYLNGSVLLTARESLEDAIEEIEDQIETLSELNKLFYDFWTEHYNSYHNVF